MILKIFLKYWEDASGPLESLNPRPLEPFLK